MPSPAKRFRVSGPDKVERWSIGPNYHACNDIAYDHRLLQLECDSALFAKTIMITAIS